MRALAKRLGGLVVVGAASANCAAADHSYSLAILEPRDGEVVTSPVRLRLATHGVQRLPAGPLKPGSGHFHVLIDEEPVPAGVTLTPRAGRLDLVEGQDSVELSLPPGTHKITAQFANGVHQSFGYSMSQSVTVSVR